MKFEHGKIRNFTIAGHSGCGKTSLSELILFKAGAIDRRGTVQHKTTASDYTNEEHEKLSSIYATPLFCTWQENSLFFIDTPGYGEFIGETVSGLNGSENALLVVDGVTGIATGTIKAWKLAKEMNIPRFFFINRLDCQNADFYKILSQLQEAFGKTVCIPVTIPDGNEADFKAVANLLSHETLSPELEEIAGKYREALMDSVAESDENLMNRYLNGEKLSEQEISTGLHKAILSGSLVPVFAGSVEKDIGISELMNGIINLFMPPLYSGKIKVRGGEEIDAKPDTSLVLAFKALIDPFIGNMTFLHVVSGSFKSNSDVINMENGTKEHFGQLFVMDGKTQIPAEEICAGCIAAVTKLKNTKIGNTLSVNQNSKKLPEMIFPNPVMSYALTATKSGEEEKISMGLHKLMEADHTLKVERHNETHELLLHGMGDLHLHNAVKKLKELAKVDVNMNPPRIPYRETITSGGDGHYKHKKQSGGHGQFAEVYLRLSPCQTNYEFSNDVVGGSIPRNFIPAVEKGVVEAMVRGPLAACTVEKVKVSVYDGKHHPVDSSEMAFKIAARMAFRDAMSKAKPVLLEPIMNVQIIIPDNYMGDISGDLNHKRGHIVGMNAEEGMQIVTAKVPLAELSKYAAELRSMTQGRGSFEMEFSNYEVVPPNVATSIIANAKHVVEEDL